MTGYVIRHRIGLVWTGFGDRWTGPEDRDHHAIFSFATIALGTALRDCREDPADYEVQPVYVDTPALDFHRCDEVHA